MPVPKVSLTLGISLMNCEDSPFTWNINDANLPSLSLLSLLDQRLTIACGFSGFDLRMEVKTLMEKI